MRISIFDFDDTLKNTQPVAPVDWTSEKSSYRSRSSLWQSTPASIYSPIGKHEGWNESVVEAARNRLSDPFTVSIFMTARDKRSASIILAALKTRDLLFDAHIFLDDAPLLDDDLNLVQDEMGDAILEPLRPNLFKQSMTWCIACWMMTGEIPYKKFTGISRVLPLSHVDEIEVFEDNEENIEAIRAVADKIGCLFKSHRIEMLSEQWRGGGDPPLPGDYNKGAPKKRTPPRDATYGSEPDMLDRPGVIVEPDVRKKISDYFKKMRLREAILQMIQDV